MMKPQKKGSTVRDTEENVNLRKAGKPFALKQIEKAFTGSKIKDNSSTYPQFDFNEVTLGKVLGKGGFGTVYEIRGFEAGKQAKASADDDDDDSDSPPGQIESRQFIAEHCIRKGGDARYALKILSPEVIAEPGTYLQGTVDMAVETRILSDVEHANIVKMRACAKVSPVDETYFIVLDRLYDTMERRMHSWAAANKRLGGMGGKLLDRKGTKKKEILEQKLVAAFDLCAAIGYLHGKNIIYRDLKPENVGFDIRDDVKLFDFGLSKELTPALKPDDDGLYKLSAMTGSPRYTMYSDTVPFELYGMNAMNSRVWNGEKKRPFVQESWPVPVKSLMRRAWSVNIKDRPNFTQIYTILKKECVRIRGGNDDGLEHHRRRSTFVFQGAKGKRLSGFGSKELKVIVEDGNCGLETKRHLVPLDRITSVIGAEFRGRY